VQPSAANELFFSYGIGEQNTGSVLEPTNGIYFFFDQNNATWQFRSNRGGATTTIDTGVTWDLVNWNNLFFKVESTALVRAYANGVSVGTIATNVQPDDGVQPYYNHIFLEPAGAQAVDGSIDCDRVLYGRE
jgi:hypothetical protein